ncbi:MAG: ABC transporter permease [Gemmatimonadetes bacterium]|nr:ABC transporter permease [Gemmatimonadota bacterium]MBK9980190.1 ABC transporter permease [Gemmatimonadota bacterium]
MTTALGQIVANKLRSFFTLLGIIVSVAFLVAVIAIIQGMNAFVKENIADAMIGANTFQVRRTPINVGRISDDEINRINRRPKITPRDAEAVRSAIPDADAVSFQSGWPTPRVDLVWRNERVADVILFGVTEQFQIVQDYRAEEGRSLSDVDVAQRRAVIVIGRDIADALFPNLTAVGKTVRILGEQFEVIGVNAGKGQVLGQSFDTYALMPSTRFEMLFGRRSTTVISVKMAEADAVEPAMQRAEEAMRVARGLRPGDDNDFSIETSDALVAFWKTVTRLLFAIIPAVVAIGVVVGGIVIMNIMLMAVTERTHEIGIRKAVGARAEDIERQFLGEAVVLATLGGVIGVSAGWLFALAIAAASPLPARVTAWSVLLSLALGAGVGILFGVYPARRAARLDPIAALRAE